MDLRNATDLEFTDIRSEQWRSYTFPGGDQVTINEPAWLAISQSGNHRILDKDRVSHLVTAGWIHLAWEAHEGQPHFVK